MAYGILDKVDSVEDLKALPEEELVPLCADIRRFLIDSTKENGGHLASNLGVTELTVALHRVFNSPSDHLIFDVGHQAYVHKILTGRKSRFSTLRKPGGLSGFTLRRESEHDPFGAGHSSTSISAALGFAESDKILGNENFTVCVIGDGAYTGGMVHEAINNCNPDLRLIIILNENGMSISKNKGAFASYLSRVRMSKRYRKMKSGATTILSKTPLVGKPIKALLSFFKRALKKVLFTSNYFEDLGFYYLGPIDGNDYGKVERALVEAKRLNKCVFVHLKTTKGKGLDEAERAPEEFHSVCGGVNCSSFHAEFAKELTSIASRDDKIVAVTAAMGIGTGLSSFGLRFPDRYFDVGIAEEHAVTFSAGLAANGFKPYAAIYSTFLQRGYDNILHDVALQKLPVRMIIDRAGISVADGATHHGIFDVSFLSHIPGIEILAPATYGSLRAMLRYSASVEHPLALRYSNASESSAVVQAFYKDEAYDCFGIRADFDENDPPANIFVTYGKLVDRVLAAKAELTDKGIPCGIILVERIKPYEPLCEYLIAVSSKGTRILFAEEGIKNGGAGMIVGSMIGSQLCEIGADYRVAAIDDSFLTPDHLCDVYDYAGISSDKLCDYFLHEEGWCHKE